jgi:hypothetical protein
MEKEMSISLETIEKNSLYSRFGICEDLTDEEMETVDGGWCVNINVCGCNGGNSSTNSGNNTGGGSGNGNGSGTSHSGS